MTEEKDLIVKEGRAPTVQDLTEVVKAQTEALTVLANSMQTISGFLTNGLPQVLAGYSKSQAVSAVFNGLMAKEGRNGLDPRFIKQNAIEVISAIEEAHTQYKKLLDEKARGERDPELHDGEREFKAWKDAQKS